MNIGILAVDSNFPNLALMKISAYHKARGDQVEWYTPREIIEALGEFDLDPCAPMHPLWPTAKIMYNKQDNGLIQNWGGEFGLTLRTPNRLYGSL